jgi:hypothetical protein
VHQQETPDAIANRVMVSPQAEGLARRFGVRARTLRNDRGDVTNSAGRGWLEKTTFAEAVRANAAAREDDDNGPGPYGDTPHIHSKDTTVDFRRKP